MASFKLSVIAFLAIGLYLDTVSAKGVNSLVESILASDDAAEIAKDLDDIEQSDLMMALGQAMKKVENSDEMKALGEAIKKLQNNEEGAKLIASAQAILTDELKVPQVEAITKCIKTTN
ncbi:uncharacterized protein LOC115556797 [Gadus morhua]|uniref:uncharacterized protein LOC115556797 n=1 Tax=Gadus morhua TaxID=8049 RepID=UPI0011B6551F|nr:uncharacterized protein LOC115556797 [Gadus morhua]